MTIWQVVGALFAMVTFTNVAYLFALKMILARHQAHLDEKLSTMAKASGLTDAKVARLEKDVSELRLDVTRNYVHKEDWVRFSTGLSAKIDGMWLALDGLKDRFYGRQ